MRSLSNDVCSFPPVISYAHLSMLLGRTVGTLKADRCRKPGSLPPACTPPGTRQPLWLLSDVIGWLEEHREAPAPRRAGRPPKIRKSTNLPPSVPGGAGVSDTEAARSGSCRSEHLQVRGSTEVRHG